MRTFPYPIALASLLAASASTPQPPPEPAPSASAPSGSGLVAKQVPDVASGEDAARIAELSRQAAPLVDAFLNLDAVLTRDGKQVIFVSNRDGLPQLYLADAARPDSPAKRLATWSERMTLE